MKKMLLFETRPSEDKEFAASIIDATHQWGLPGVICHVCGNTWSNVGLAYPLLSLSDLPFEEEYRTPRAVPFAEFVVLKNRLATVLPRGTLLLPGTEFGPLIGSARGKFGDFAWLNPWTLLIRSRAYGRLQEAGIHLPMKANQKVMFKGNDNDTFAELQVEPGALLMAEASAGTTCAACGYSPLRLPDPIVVAQSSIPGQLDLFRAKNFTTLIFATAAFVKAATELGLSGIEFSEVTVSK